MFKIIHINGLTYNQNVKSNKHKKKEHAFNTIKNKH